MRTPGNAFPAISPGMARELFMIKNDSWADRFKENFNQFIVAPLEYSRPIIKLPLPPSRTGNHALVLVTNGQAEMTVGHELYTLTEKTLVIVPALQIFTIDAICKDTTGFLSFFNPELVRSAAHEVDFDFLKLTSNPFMSLSAQQATFVRNLLDRLTVEYSENGSVRLDLIRPYLLALLVEINQVYVGSVAAKTDAGDRLVQRFMDLVATQIRTTRLTSQYADQLNISPNHLNKVIKSRTGKSPSVWIDERVILEARVLLFQSSLSIAQIAHELGFDDPSTFGKLFRKYTRTSPTDFRKMIDLTH